MEMRKLGHSGLWVSSLAFGALTFGGKGETYQAIGSSDIDEAKRLIQACIDHGINFFDTANIYAEGASEQLLGEAIGRRRGDVVIATKASLRTGPGPFDVGSSRRHLIQACEDSLRRLQTDWIDLYQLHAFDALTPLEETLRALEELVRAGKVRHVGCSNFAGWQLMKALATAERDRTPRFASQQIYYSLVGRDVEHELMPLSLDQDVGVIVWGGLANGFLSGKFQRDQTPTQETRLGAIPETRHLFDWERGHDVLDVARRIASEREVPVSQVAMNWLLRKPAVSAVLIGARSEAQLRQNLGAADWVLSPEEVAALDSAYPVAPPYPIWHQRSVYGAERNPVPPTYRA